MISTDAAEYSRNIYTRELVPFQLSVDCLFQRVVRGYHITRTLRQQIWWKIQKLAYNISNYRTYNATER